LDSARDSDSGIRSGSFDENVGLFERLPIAGTTPDRSFVAVVLDVADQDARVRELTLEFLDRMQRAAVVMHWRHIDPLARQFHLPAVGVNDHGENVEELEAEGILRHLDLRRVAGLDLIRRDFTN